MPRPKSILVVKTSSLGDVVRVLPALTDASKALPGIEFDWVVEESFVEIPAWHQTVKNIIPIAWRRWRKNLVHALSSGELINAIRDLRQQRYDMIIDAQGLIKSAVVTKLARGVSVGYDRDSIREKLASCFYDHKMHIPLDQHSVLRMRKLFALALNYPMPDSLPDYGINFADTITQREPYLVFFHGTTDDKRCWSEQKWLDLAKLATANQYIVYLPWGNQLELERAKRIAERDDKIKVLPKLTISVLAQFLQHARCVVAVDTGFGHIAAALGVPLVSLYGPTIPRLAGTVGLNQEHIAYITDFDQATAADVWQAVCAV